MFSALFAVVRVDSVDVHVTPVEKVTNLLKRLQKQVEEQGKDEAASYDKYACFCKEQSNEKRYMIEKSKEKIEKLDVKIDYLASAITDKNQEVITLNTDISTLENDIKQATDVRSSEHDAYVAKNEDLSSAIAAIEGAITALEDSKAGMSGVKLDFAQVRTAAGIALAAASKANVKETSLAKILALARAKQNPSTYAYQSNEILSTLRELLDIFNRNKKEADEDEFDTKAAFDKNDLSMKLLKQFKEKEKSEIKQEIDSMTEEKQTSEQERSEEAKDQKSDKEFLVVLVGECETKAGEWDARSKTRADELSAISQAIDALVGGVAPSWKANKKLVGLEQKTRLTKRRFDRSVSFLQIRDADRTEKAEIYRKKVRAVLTLLSEASKRLDSSVLQAAFVRTQATGDHFVKVRAIIKDLMARLVADKNAEASTKSDCDRIISENVNNRDESKTELEKLATKKHELDSEKVELASSIATLAADIQSLNKALLEATELRNEESTENAKTVATAEEGLSSVRLALSVLKDFYGSDGPPRFIQYIPPDSDREGLTVSDRAPDIWKSGYEGSKPEAKGIIGLLEVIESDFERTISATQTRETEAQTDFDTFSTATSSDVSQKSASKVSKEGRAVAVDDLIVGNEQETMMQDGLLGAAESSLEGAKKMCVDAEETYEERVAKREKEIEALKEAKRILDEWQ